MLSGTMMPETKKFMCYYFFQSNELNAHDCFSYSKIFKIMQMICNQHNRDGRRGIKFWHFSQGLPKWTVRITSFMVKNCWSKYSRHSKIYFMWRNLIGYMICSLYFYRLPILSTSLSELNKDFTSSKSSTIHLTF